MEATLGPIECGYQHDWPFHVLRFFGGPVDECCTFVTLGLSDHILVSAHSQREFRQELVLMARPEWRDRNIPGILHQVGTEILSNHQPLLNGQVLGPRGELFDGTKMQALFVTSPRYFPDAFGTYIAADGSVRIFAWLIPITADEAHFVQQYGRNAFEETLFEHDPELLDFHRGSIV